MRNKLTKFLTSECPPRGNKGIFAKTWKYTACMLLALVLSVGNVWAQLTPALPATTLTLPTIPTEGWKGEVTPTYYKAAGSNVYVFCPYELYKSVADLTWTTQNNGGNASPTLDALAPFPASSVFTGYKAATLNGTSKGPYAYRVTNCVKAYVRCVSGSNKKRTITLAAYEIDGEGNVAASAAASDTYEANSDGVISIDLNMNKEYYIKVSQVGSGSGGSSSGNSTFYMLGLQAPYKVTLDPDGGSYPSNTLAGWTYDNVNDKYSKYVAAGSLTLPSAPSKGGYDFTEWQDNKANAYTTSITIDKDTVLTAQWIAAGSAYDVNIASMTNGSVVASPTSQVEDGTVTLTVTPDDGYLLSSLSVVGDVSGDEVTVTANQFTMPAEDVTINATFSLAPTYTVTLNPAGGTIVDATGWTLNAGNYEKEVAEGTVLTLPTFTKDGRTFKTWRKAGPADVASPVTVDGDLSLTAIWTATIEQGIYSWESPDGTPIEVGGTAKFYNGDTDASSTAAPDNRVNYANKPVSGDDVTQYYTLRLDKAVDYSTEHVRISLNSALKEGDKIAITAYYTKEQAKTVAPKIANGSNEVVCSADNLANLYNGGTPATQTKTLNDKAEGATTLKLTRSATSTTAFITKLQIIREVQVEEGDLLTVTLNYNDGVTPNATIQVASGQAVAQPANPTWAHHRFNEWQLAGSAYDFSSAVTGNITLVADWTQLYTISFANGGGSGDAPAAIADKAKDETFEVPANTFTAPEGKEFDKWNDGSADYAPGATYTVGTANVVLTAQWKAVTAKYTVIFKDGETTLDTKLFEVGSNPSDADIDKTKPLFAFAAWQKDAADIALDDAFWATVLKDATVTLTARWTKAYATSYDMEAYAASVGASKAGLEEELTAAGYAYTNINGIDNGHTHNYTYDGMKYKTNDGDLSFNVVAGKVVEVKTGHLPSNDAVIMNINGVADATVFEGANEASETHKTNYFYSAVEALYRLDVLASKGTCAVKAVTIRDPFTVSFEAHGDADPSPLNGTPFVTLPDATNGTASLLGWFDAETGGNKIGDAGATYIPTANITLHAQWESVSTDARLASITLDPSTGAWSPAFDPEVVNYTYTMPYGTADVPQITGATAVNAGGSYSIISQAAAWGETAVIRGVAASSDTKAYNITMLRAPKDGASIFKAELTSATTATYSGIYADADNSQIKLADDGANGYKFGGTSNFIKMTLDGGTFATGDLLTMTYSKDPQQGELAIYENTTKIVGTSFENHTLEFTAGADGLTELFIRRTSDNDFNGWVSVVEVTRVVNPILTAITINGEAGTINESAKTVAVELQPGYDLAALTIVPTIVSNTAEASVVKTVESNGGAWVIGDNTYRLTDKDGDYTEYTVTLSVGEVKHTVSFNTHGGSAVASVEVVEGEKLAAAPADPTKEDYIFQGWSATDGGSIIDITDVTIDEPKTFHAVWAADGAIKLLDGATVNHTNFITGVTADETVEFMGNTINYAKFSGTVSGVNGVKDLTRVIAYNATTNKTKIRISAHNNSTNARSILVKGLVEGADAAVDLATIDLGNKEDKVSDWIEFDNAANRTIYIMVPSSAGDVYFTQVKVIESGETPMKQAGETGYSLNFNKGRFFGVKDLTAHFEGLDVEVASSDCAPLNTEVVKLNNTSMNFTVASAMTLSVTTNNNKTYYVTEGAAGTDNETAKTGVSEFNLTAGTWYITAGASNVEITNIAFSAPKCAEPVIDAQPASKLDFAAGDMTASVTAHATDDGTLKYQWYKAADDSEVTGQTTETLTTTEEGTYYVIVTNTLADHSDNFVKSDEATLKYRKADDATLSSLTVSAGTLAPAFDPEVLEYNVTLSEGTVDVPTLTATAAMAAYGATADVTNAAAFVNYEATSTVLVTAEDHSTQQTYIVHFYVDHLLPQVAVSANTTWDWENAGENMKLLEDGTTNPNKNEEAVMANIKVGDKQPTNNATFNSQALVFYGENVRAKDGDRYYASIGHISFNVTVPGKVTVEFSDNGTNNRKVSINGALSESSASKTDVKTFTTIVPAGEVMIEGVNEDGTGNNRYIRISKIIFNATPDYTRPVSNNIGTLCVDHNVPAAGLVGATFYQLAGKEPTYGKLVFDEVTELVAGEPYIFESTTGSIALYYGETVQATPVEVNHMIGSYVDTEVEITEENKTSVMYIASNKLWDCSDYQTFTNQKLQVVANRAYIANYDAIGAPASASPAPGRRRITVGKDGQNAATDVDLLNAAEAPVKMIIDGKMYILRGEKMYDATGRLVK